MSKTNHDDTNTVSIVLDQQSSENNFFTINSHKAAEILGVNRTRLSQLTSQGIFPYERRKVDARSRLYYRLNDLLNYQRRSSFGNLNATTSYEPNKYQNAALMIPPSAVVESQKSSQTALATIKKLPIVKNNQIKSGIQKSGRIDRNLMAALTHKTQQTGIENLKETHEILKKLEKNFNKIVESLARLEGAITQIKTQSLKRQKAVSRSPGIKRPFKFIKR